MSSKSAVSDHLSSMIELNSRLASSAPKVAECYLGLLYVMDDVAAYGYITPLKVKMVITLALTDSVVRDVEVITVSLVL